MQDRAGREHQRCTDFLQLPGNSWAMTEALMNSRCLQAQLVSASAAHDSNGNVLQGGSHVYPELAAAGLWTELQKISRYF